MAKKEAAQEAVTISPPKLRVVEFQITGDSPYVQCRFSQKAMNMMREKMEAGQTAKKGKARDPRDFNADFENAKHISTEGWPGIPAAAFRNACIDVCRMAGYKMTHARMSIFCEADGFDRVDGSPLVRLIADEPEVLELPVRNATGVADIRVRPMWRNWSAKVRIRFDEDQFKLSDIANMVNRAGMQCGVGEGRAYSKQSNGLGYGFFHISGGAQ